MHGATKHFNGGEGRGGEGRGGEGQECFNVFGIFSFSQGTKRSTGSVPLLPIMDTKPDFLQIIRSMQVQIDSLLSIVIYAGHVNTVQTTVLSSIVFWGVLECICESVFARGLSD